jgi:hypothetical protein
LARKPAGGDARATLQDGRPRPSLAAANDRQSWNVAGNDTIAGDEPFVSRWVPLLQLLQLLQLLNSSTPELLPSVFSSPPLHDRV